MFIDNVACLTDSFLQLLHIYNSLPRVQIYHLGRTSAEDGGTSTQQMGCWKIARLDFAGSFAQSVLSCHTVTLIFLSHHRSQTVLSLVFRAIFFIAMLLVNGIMMNHFVKVPRPTFSSSSSFTTTPPSRILPPSESQQFPNIHTTGAAFAGLSCWHNRQQFSQLFALGGFIQIYNTIAFVLLSRLTLAFLTGYSGGRRF